MVDRLKGNGLEELRKGARPSTDPGKPPPKPPITHQLRVPKK